MITLNDLKCPDCGGNRFTKVQAKIHEKDGSVKEQIVWYTCSECGKHVQPD